MIKIILTICCAFFSQWAAASYFAQNNVSSLLLRNADLLETGQVTVDLSVFADSYNVDGNTSQDVDGYVLPGVAYGLNDRLSLGLMMPVVAVNQNTTGMRELNATAKYLIGGRYDDGVAVTLSGFAGLVSAAASEGLGSGDSSYGLAMNISLYGNRTALNFSMGGEKSDIKAQGSGSGYSAEQQLILSGGFEYRLGDRWKYLIEGVYTRTNSLDDNFLLMPGVRYTPNEKMNFYLGAAVGVPSDTSIPEWRLTTGVAVNFGGRSNQLAQARKFIPDVMLPSSASSAGYNKHFVASSLPKAYNSGLMKVAAQNSTSSSQLSSTDSLLLQQMEALRSDVGKLINTPPNVIARIEIQNASGIRGMGEQVAELLAKRGYSVVSISDIAKSIQRPSRIYYKGGTKNAEIVRIDHARLSVLKQSRIYYIEGFQQRATRVSMTLPGSQRVIPDDELVNVAEIRIVIGKDMKALLRKRPIHLPSV